MKRGSWGIGAAVAVIALILVMPAPKRIPAAGLSSAPTGPPTVATVWPKARPFPIPATFPDGATFTPSAVLDRSTAIGLLASADGTHGDLALVPATGASLGSSAANGTDGAAPRILQDQSVADGGSFDGITATADQVFWMHTVSDADGHAKVSLWSASRAGGPARQLTGDVGAPIFFGSGYDVQVVGDQLRWAATPTGRSDATELRSIPLAGGPVTVRVVPGSWAPSAWPWLVTAPGATNQVRLHNVDTGVETTVRAPAHKQVTCSPSWCRLIPDNAAGPTETDLIRPDGSQQRVIGGASDAAIASDVALRDRFEVLMAMVSTSGQVTVSRLSLFDITTGRAIQVEGAATNAGARGDFVWWSTGDNETLAWHALDLRTLT